MRKQASNFAPHQKQGTVPYPLTSWLKPDATTAVLRPRTELYDFGNFLHDCQTSPTNAHKLLSVTTVTSFLLRVQASF